MNTKNPITKNQSCADKQTFYNFNDANSVLGQLKKGSLSLYYKGYVYECNVCHWYHITTKLTQRQKERIRKARIKQKSK